MLLIRKWRTPSPSFPPPVLLFHTISTPTPTPCAFVSTFNRCDTRRPSLVDLILCFFFICLNTKKKVKSVGLPHGARDYTLTYYCLAPPLPPSSVFLHATFCSNQIALPYITGHTCVRALNDRLLWTCLL